jgi:hypothetical protein
MRLRAVALGFYETPEAAAGGETVAPDVVVLNLGAHLSVGPDGALDADVSGWSRRDTLVAGQNLAALDPPPQAQG